MQALIDFIIKNFLKIWPVSKVTEWSTAMRVRGGKIQSEIAKPGLVWRWPVLDEIVTYPTSEIGIDLDTATITTTDEKTVTISANLAYRCISIKQMWKGVWSTDVTIKNNALGEIAAQCAAMSWVDLRSNRTEMERRLVAALNVRAKQWGVEVMHCNLTDLVQSRQYRHYVDGMRSAK